MSANFLSPKAQIRLDAAGRSAAFAGEPITAGETVAAFGGRCVSRSELDSHAGRSAIHAVQIDDDLFLVTDLGSGADATVSHSCSPNCGMAGGVLVVAMRDIPSGEALTYDHAMTSGCDFNDFECACGTPNCRGKVTGRDWMHPELQLAYRGYFSPYLAKRIARLVRTGAERRAFAL